MSQREETRHEAADVLKDANMDVDLTETLSELEAEMLSAANNLEFEKAALLRDQINELKRAVDGPPASAATPAGKASYRKGAKRRPGRKSPRPSQ